MDLRYEQPFLTHNSGQNFHLYATRLESYRQTLVYLFVLLAVSFNKVFFHTWDKHSLTRFVQLARLCLSQVCEINLLELTDS